jgi:hypothetical protein
MKTKSDDEPAGKVGSMPQRRWKHECRKTEERLGMVGGTTVCEELEVSMPIGSKL